MTMIPFTYTGCQRLLWEACNILLGICRMLHQAALHLAAARAQNSPLQEGQIQRPQKSIGGPLSTSRLSRQGSWHMTLSPLMDGYDAMHGRKASVLCATESTGRA